MHHKENGFDMSKSVVIPNGDKFQREYFLKLQKN